MVSINTPGRKTRDMTDTSRTNNTIEKVKLQMDVPIKTRDDLDELVREIGATSRGEAFRRALGILRLCVAANKRNAKFGFKEEDGTLTWLELLC